MTLENIKMLTEIRGKKNYPLIDIQFVVMRDNEHQIKEMLRLVQETGADKLSLKKFQYKPTDDNKDKIEEIMPKNRDYAQYVEENAACYRAFNSAVI